MSWQSIRNRWARLKAALPRPAPSGSVKDGPILSFQALIVSVAAILYFLGWMYLYYYLFEFGIDIFALEIPFYYIFVYSFAVIRHSFQANMAGVLIAASTAILVYGVTRYFVPRAASFVLLAFASSAFLLGHSAAISAARDRSEQLRFDPTSFVEVVFPSDNDVVKTDQHLSRLNEVRSGQPRHSHHRLARPIFPTVAALSARGTRLPSERQSSGAQARGRGRIEVQAFKQAQKREPIR
jgi:hypothetical protein